MKLKGNSLERRIEIARQSIERNKDRKQRREKAEKKLEELLKLQEELPMLEEQHRNEVQRRRDERRKKTVRKNSEKKIQRTVSIYHSKYIEREQREEELYNTWEELENPPEGELGRLNPNYREFINKARKWFEECQRKAERQER